MRNGHPEPPWEGGSKRVVEIPMEVPKSERSTGQMLVNLLMTLSVLAGALWVLVPILS